VLFDEMYVTDPKQRFHNAALFYGVYQFLTGSGGPAVDKDVDARVLRAGFMAFWNMAYLSDEYNLAHKTSEREELKEPPEIESLKRQSEKIELDPKRMRAAAVMQFAAKANAIAAVYRKALPPAAFQTAAYQKNLAQRRAVEDKYEKPYRVVKGFEQFGISDNVEIYNIKRGLFDLFFVEERGQLRVLTLGFEL
jgi:hypothetical protein